MPRLDRGIQYAVANVARASASTEASGILDRPVKPGDDTEIVDEPTQSAEVVPYDSRISNSRRPSPFKSFFTALEATTSPSLA
ncbi:hypothetical protein ACVWZV_003593 [Bradyrhizobium sp. GM5.1]|jgi:hypothetical protein